MTKSSSKVKVAVRVRPFNKRGNYGTDYTSSFMTVSKIRV